MQSPVGKIVTEIRAGLAVDGGPAVTVRGGRRFEGDATHAGDGTPLVLVRVNSRTRTRGASAGWRLVTLAYAKDPRLAMDLDMRVSQILHNVGPRRTPGSLGVYHSSEDVGGQAGEDPDTGWSSVTSIYIVHGSTVTP